MKIKFYGKLGERLAPEIDVDPPAGTETVDQLRNMLADMFPDASRDLREGTRACVADSVVGEHYKLAGNDTVEFLPPLSGG